MAEAAAVSVRSQNRAADPEFAEWLDDMRSMFAAELARVEWPDGRIWGTVREIRISMSAAEWLDYVNDPNPRPLGVQWQR